MEEALLTDGTEEIDSNVIDNRLIQELLVSLVRGCMQNKTPWRLITTSNYQMFLRRLLRRKCEQQNINNPFNTDTDFHSLPIRTKIIILHLLCDFRLDAKNVLIQLDKLEPDSLRIEPLGYVLYYFHCLNTND